MLDLYPKFKSPVDRINRRALLKVGSISLGGLSLPSLLKAKEASATRRDTAVIFVHLAGGPSQLETYDPKPNAPVEFRGPLGVVPTSSPGVHFSELMVEQSRIFDKIAVVRSVHHNFDQSSNHRAAGHLLLTGYPISPKSRADEYPRNPGCGALASHILGPNRAGVPPYVLMQNLPGDVGYSGGAYLGRGNDPLIIQDDPNAADFKIHNLSMPRGLSFNRLSDRRHLLNAFEESRRRWDVLADEADVFQQRAFELIAGDEARDAFDLSQESNTTRDRYGRHRSGQSFLLARRLVEAGVTFVEVMPRGGSGGGWDDHDGIEKPMRIAGPAYDQGMAALISDLCERGLDRKVLVIAMGEFGRSPRINPKRTGRDHWPAVYSALFAGGGYTMGQIIGSSNANAEIPISSPYGPENVLAMLYHHLGIDPSQTFPDFAGRPRYILEERGFIQELMS
ncbi:MAG: DUF1501 domain-containing protein [Planctomycetota bacterium]|nr:DUF1501 domain-containing protein [Planctomycetota bacterium]MDA1213264.1 DUF1501 domain-containing protein [Planctomycetota bacterium]